MPRSVESPESKILHYFRTAPLEAASLLLGLVRGEMKDRHDVQAVVGAPLKPPVKHHATPKKAKSHHKQVATGGAHNWTSPHERPGAGAPKGHKPTGKKRSHHKRPRPTNGAEGAEVEGFGAAGD